MDDDRKSEAVRAQKREWLPNIFSMAENHTQIIFVGTRWHPDDLYKTIMKDYPQFVMYKQGIYNPDGSLWLAEFYEERLPILKKHPVHFSHQYMNEAIAGDDKRVYLEWFKDTPMPDRDNFALIVIGIDPAFAERDETKLCFKTAAVLGVDKENNVWLLDGALSRGSLEKFKDNEVRRLYRRWLPQYVRIENNGPQKGAELFFKTDREYGKRVRGTKANMAKDKFARAQGWLAHAETHGIYTVRGSWWEEAAYQLDYFPYGDYKDFPDGLSCAWPDVENILKRSREVLGGAPLMSRERTRLPAGVV
jgi:predicted phage terminase large subunit-like protein